MVIRIIGIDGANYDTRQGKPLQSKDILLISSLLHRQDVRRLGLYLMQMLEKSIGSHDWTKIKYIDEFYDNFVEFHKTKRKFKDNGWWQKHRNIEKHHIFDYDGTEPINLIDFLDLCCDWVAAGIARSEKHKFTMNWIKEAELDPEVIKDALYNAFLNTLNLLSKESRYKEEKM